MKWAKPMMDMSEFTGEFVAEAKENLDGIEGILMDLERTADAPDPELVNRAFRAVHSIKGGAAFLGLDRLNELSHAMESLMSLIRSREIRPDAAVVDTLLAGVDLLNEMLDGVHRGDAFDISGALAAIQDVQSEHLHPDVKADLSATVSLVDEAGCGIPFTIDLFTFNRLDEGVCLYSLAYDLNEMAATLRETPMVLIERLLASGDILDARLDAPADDLHGDLAEIPLIYEVLYASPEPAAGLGEKIGGGLRRMERVRAEGRGDGRRQGRSEKRPDDLTDDLPDDLPDDRTDDRKDAPSVGADAGECDPPASGSESRRERSGREVSAGIRIAEDKVDALVNLAGEFATVQAALMVEAKSLKAPRLLSIAERVERLSTDLRDVALAVRMLPIRTAFGRFRRLVRDLSRHHGKEMVLVTEGGSAELDKTVLEGLYDPLTHILRNSIDHGMEPADARAARGKPAHGTITMTARHEGGHMILDIADDGAGIDPAEIRKKAVDKGIVSRLADLDDAALLQLVFTPGFSTVDAVTDLSGRGVGMDVVKRRVEALQGGVSIQSRKGRGTTISLKIPMSMAIIDGLLVRLDDARYLVPLSEASECVDLRDADLSLARSRGAMGLRGRLIPYICLSRWLTSRSDLPGDEYVIVIKRSDGFVGLGVDKVVGFHQAVIKPLGKACGDAKMFSGSTILGDGGVALILDVHYLIETYAKENTRE